MQGPKLNHVKSIGLGLGLTLDIISDVHAIGDTNRIMNAFEWGFCVILLYY